MCYSKHIEFSCSAFFCPKTNSERSERHARSFGGMGGLCLLHASRNESGARELWCDDALRCAGAVGGHLLASGPVLGNRPHPRLRAHSMDELSPKRSKGHCLCRRRTYRNEPRCRRALDRNARADPAACDAAFAGCAVCHRRPFWACARKSRAGR